MDKHAVSVVVSGIKALTANAKRLGITWQMAMATSISSEGSSQEWVVIMDGDASNTPIKIISLIGVAPNFTRVAVLSLSHGGNYAIGLISSNPLPHCAGTGLHTFGSGTTTSASFSDTPGASSLVFTKLSSTSRLFITAHLNTFSTVGSTKARFAVTVDGGANDTNIAEAVLSAANSVIGTSGSCILDGVAAGAVTIQLRWRRVSGTGTLTMSTDQTYVITVCETA